jgi:peptidyl-dipeptidase Dcp
MADKNPLLMPSPLPYELPPFVELRDEHFEPAYAQGMAEHLQEIGAITRSGEPASFENTIVAMERAGQLLARTNRAFGILTNSFTNPGLQQIESEIAPKLAAHLDAIRLDPVLFARVRELHERRDQLGLDAEGVRLVERYYKDFVLAGADLGEVEKARLRELNGELAELSTHFSQAVLKEVNASAVVADSREELAGLPEAGIDAAAALAESLGHSGKFAIRLTNTTGQPPLKRLENRELRQRVMAASLARGSRGGEFDVRGVVLEIVRKRSEKARLLGFATHADLQLEDQTAKTVETVNAILARLAGPAVANARREAAEMQALVDVEGGGFEFSAADWDFYAERLRKSRFDFDEGQLRPFYEMRRVLIDGVFFAATKLYGITFTERSDLQGYSPEMLVFEVFDRDGSALGLFLGDFYARPNKRGGAWANAYVPQSGLLGTKPVIGNHLNIPKPPEGEPTLMTHDEVQTMFHEFGHALHGLFSAVRFPRFAGTSVPRDFVEYPSQVNEMWSSWPEVFANYARHFETDEAMPAELLAKVEAASLFNEGFRTTELLAAAILDQAWHQLDAASVPGDVLAFESGALARNGVDFDLVPPRYRTTYFSHVFSGGYSAGYYSYIWSEVLDADSVEWFRENGGLTRANGDHFRESLLSRGGSVDAMEMYRAFRGRDPEIGPLLRRRGLD